MIIIFYLKKKNYYYDVGTLLNDIRFLGIVTHKIRRLSVINLFIQTKRCVPQIIYYYDNHAIFQS